jgi:hypothetical protein
VRRTRRKTLVASQVARLSPATTDQAPSNVVDAGAAGGDVEALDHPPDEGEVERLLQTALEGVLRNEFFERRFTVDRSGRACNLPTGPRP